MPETPRWLKVLKVFFLLCVPMVLLAAANFYSEGEPEFDEMFPVSMIVLGISHLVYRAPYTRWTWWEFPFTVLSLGLVTAGAFLFTPEGEERLIPFQCFIAVFAFLALSYGLFCSSVKHNSPLRKSIIEPTKKVSHFGIIGFDIGMVLAPFAFLFLLVKHLRTGPKQ